MRDLQYLELLLCLSLSDFLPLFSDKSNVDLIIRKIAMNVKELVVRVFLIDPEVVLAV